MESEHTQLELKRDEPRGFVCGRRMITDVGVRWKPVGQRSLKIDILPAWGVVTKNASESRRHGTRRRSNQLRISTHQTISQPTSFGCRHFLQLSTVACTDLTISNMAEFRNSNPAWAGTGENLFFQALQTFFFFFFLLVLSLFHFITDRRQTSHTGWCDNRILKLSPN